MRALVVYESMFGNNQAVARAIADGIIASGGAAEAVEVGVAPTTIPAEVDMLIVGAPTHAFSLSRATGRASVAAERGGDIVSKGIGVREWLTTVAPARPGLAAIAYDTSSQKPAWLSRFIDRVPGLIAAGLRKRKFTVLSARQHFRCSDRTTLAAGELERARAWGAQLATGLAARATR